MKSGRILSLIIAVILIVSTLCVAGFMSVAAAETEITSAEEFKNMTDGNYKLTADIDLAGVGFTTITSFTGTLDGNGKTVKGIETPLFATLSGEVKNLTLEGAITTSATTAIGALTNTVDGNLKLTGVTNKASITSTASAYVGGLIGKVIGTSALTVTGCTNDGAISASGGVEGAGGLIGAIIGSAKDAHASVTVERSVNNGAVTYNSNKGDYVGVGGFVGAGDKYTLTFTESVNYGDIDYTNDGKGGAGGFFGSALKWESGKDNSRDVMTARYCVNYGEVISHSSEAQGTAGIAGRLNRGKNMTYTFEYCYNMGKITGGNYAGGIFAYTNNSTGTALTVTGCYNVGAITGSSYAHMMGLSGSLQPTLESDNYYIGTPKDKTDEKYIVEATSCADKAELNAALLSLGEYVVISGENDGYAILKWQCEHKEGMNCLGKCFDCGATLGEAQAHAWGAWVETKPANDYVSGEKERTCSKCGQKETEIIAAGAGMVPIDGVYNVESADQLTWLAHSMNAGTVSENAKIAIKADITLTDGIPFINKNFSGTLDGENHTISGLTDTLFYQLSGTVENLTIKGSLSSDEQRVGTVAMVSADNGGAKIYNVQSYVDMTVSMNGGNFGGIIGYLRGYNEIKNCTYSGTMTVTASSSAIGGIVGYTNRNGATNLVIEGCGFDGTIVFTGACELNEVGGMIGAHNASGGEEIRNCFASGSIILPEKSIGCVVGGIVGHFRATVKATVIEGCVFNGSITADGIVGTIIGIPSAKNKVLDTISITTDFPICGITDGMIEDSYASADVYTIGAPFTLGGVKYQRYNFGYVNVDESRVVSTALSTDEKLAGYLSMKDNGDKHNVKVILLANMEALRDITSASVEVEFLKDGATVKSQTLVLGGDENGFEVFKAGIAAGEAYFAKEGYQFFGVTIEDLADDSWDKIAVDVRAGGVTLFYSSTLCPQ